MRFLSHPFLLYIVSLIFFISNQSKKTNMKPSSTTIFYLIILSATIIFNSCSSDSSRETSISWDRYGVPHIKAKSTDDLFFAQGWALMQNHANKVLELYGKSRGRASEYWGEQYLQNDILIHTLGLSLIHI